MIRTVCNSSSDIVSMSRSPKAPPCLFGSHPLYFLAHFTTGANCMDWLIWNVHPVALHRLLLPWISHWGAANIVLIMMGHIMAPVYFSGLVLVHCSWGGFTPHPWIPWLHGLRWQDQKLPAIAVAARPLVDPCRACGLAGAHTRTWDAQGQIKMPTKRIAELLAT